MLCVCVVCVVCVCVVCFVCVCCLCVCVVSVCIEFRTCLGTKLLLLYLLAVGVF